MFEDTSVGSGNPTEDTSASEQAEVTDSNDSVGLTTQSVRPAGKGKQLTPEEKVQLRINKIVGQREGLREENEELHKKLAELEKKVEKVTSPDTPKYTDAELEKAITDGIAEGKTEHIGEAINQLVNNRMAALTAKQEGLTKQQEAQRKQEGMILQAIGEAYPEMSDKNSLLSKTAEEIMKRSPGLQRMGNQGWFAAASRAYRILSEEGALGNENLRNRVAKKDMAESLGSGNASGDAGDAVTSGPDENPVSKYMAMRNKNKEKLLDDISGVVKGNKR